MTAVNWDHNKVLEFIEVYRSRPLLWDPNDNNYHVRQKKQDAWTDISLQFDTDVETIKGKMASLLSSYRREKSRLRKRPGYTKSRWFAFGSFQFLPSKPPPKQVKQEGDSEDSNTEYTEAEVENEGSLFSFDDPIETITFNAPKSISDIKRRHENVQEGVTENGDGEYMLVKKQSKKDESAVFSKHIAMKLRQFSENSRKVVMHRINNVIFEEETKEFNLGN